MSAIPTWRETLGSWYKRATTWAPTVIQLFCGVCAVTWTSSHEPIEIVDYGHQLLPRIPPDAANLGVIALLGFAASRNVQRLGSALQTIYAPLMMIKATLISLTIMPDANPSCAKLSFAQCNTRNDMLPSGHMIAALAAAHAIDRPWAWAWSVLCGFALVASRMHYSVDVVLSTWLVALKQQWV